MKQGPSTMRHLRIHCTSPGSVKLVEHELWQREEKGLIGILPVQDVAKAATVDSMLSQGMGSDSGERSSGVQVCTSDSHRWMGKISRSLFTVIQGILESKSILLWIGKCFYFMGQQLNLQITQWSI